MVFALVYHFLCNMDFDDDLMILSRMKRLISLVMMMLGNLWRGFLRLNSTDLMEMNTWKL